MALLDRLDEVAWGTLTHAYGPATDVPDLLRALVFPEHATPQIQKAAGTKSIRDHVIWTLYGNVFHQGTVWQVSSHVIPFLVEILRDGPRDRVLQSFVIGYLHHLALGYPHDRFPELVDPDKEYAAAAHVGDDDDPCSDARLASYARDCYRGVEAVLPAVVPFVRASDDDLATTAIALLGSFRGEVAVAALQSAVADGTGVPRAVALVALAQLDPTAARREAAKHIADEDRYIAVHAAAALVLADPTRASPEALDVLTQPLGKLVDEHTALTGSVGTLVSRTLARLPQEHVDRVAGAICDGLAGSHPMTNLGATGSLLQLVFPDGAPANAYELTPIQRRAVEAIAAHGAFEVGDAGAQFANYSLLVGDFGLPSDRDKLKAWLAAPAS